MTTLATAAGTLLAAGAATGALWFTGQSLRATNVQLGMSQQIAVTDRFRLAAEQLASDKIDVRLSGIYLFERLAKDSPADHATVFAVLAASVRTQAPVTDCDTKQILAPVDIEAALTVIGRRSTSREGPKDGPDLTQTCLAAADLAGANLANAELYRANLINAWLPQANLSGADPFEADLYGANLYKANLNGAELYGANLTDANLSHANLNQVSLYDANLTGANLTGANLTGANLTNIFYDQGSIWPEGFVPPPSRPNP